MGYEKAKFVNFDDFYRNKKILRTAYKELSLSDKIAFKRYVYDEIKECESDKDVIWNYLNENMFCKKELMSRVVTRNKRKGKIYNLYDMIDENNKIKELEIKRIDIFNLL